MLMQLEVIVRRGSIAESRHSVHAVATNVRGEVVLAAGDIGRVTTFRSSAKPFQLLPLVERGHADRWGFSPEDLAVMCASHTGSARHLERVRGILERIGLTEGALACGYHDPLDPDSLGRIQAHPEGRSALYNNCSGKHAGMLCLALSEGWEIAGYVREDHPVQVLMRRTVAEMCGVSPESMQVAVDGCSVPVFALPLSAMARGYARLAAARADGDTRERALDRIRAAMTAHPFAIGGAGRFSTQLMECLGTRVVSKGGAEGLECAGLTESGVGIALKCEDGASRAMAPAMLAVLEQLGALPKDSRPELEALRRPLLRNSAGLEVGAIEAEMRAAVPGRSQVAT